MERLVKYSAEASCFGAPRNFAVLQGIGHRIAQDLYQRKLRQHDRYLRRAILTCAAKSTLIREYEVRLTCSNLNFFSR